MTCALHFSTRAVTMYRALLACLLLLYCCSFHVHFIPDDGHKDRNVVTIPMDLCEMQCSLECRQVACKQFKYNEAA